MTKQKKRPRPDPAAFELALAQKAISECISAIGALARKCSEELERAGESVESPDLFATGRRVGRLRALAEMADALAHIQARALWAATTGADEAPKPEWQQKIEATGGTLQVPKNLPHTPGALVAWLECEDSDEARMWIEQLMPHVDQAELDEWRPRMVRR